MDAFYNLHYIKGDDFEDLSKYADAFEKWWELSAKTGWTFGTEKFRDKLMKELAAKKNGKITHPYAILETWKSAGWETLIEDSR